MKRTQGPGFRICDAFWSQVEPLLPVRINTHRYGGGRPRAPDRRCLDGILFVLRTGCQWRALDVTGICPGSTAHDRFQEWVQAGFFHRLWQAALTDYDELKGLDWSWLSADGCQTKAPLAGEKSGPNPTDRAKQGTKRSLLVEAAGVPVALAVAGANRNDHKLLGPTLAGLPASRPMPSVQRPQGLCLDKGYDYPQTRALAAEYGLTLHLRTRGEEAKALTTEPGYRPRRWVVERTHSWLNRFRRLLVRWEKKAANYEALLHFACACITWQQARLSG